MAVGATAEDKKQVIINQKQLGALHDSLSAAHDGMVSFRDSVQGMPRMTADLNRAIIYLTYQHS